MQRKMFPSHTSRARGAFPNAFQGTLIAIVTAPLPTAAKDSIPEAYSQSETRFPLVASNATSIHSPVGATSNSKYFLGSFRSGARNISQTSRSQRFIVFDAVFGLSAMTSGSLCSASNLTYKYASDQSNFAANSRPRGADVPFQ